MRFTKICSHPHCPALIKVGDGNYCDKHKTKRTRPEYSKLYHTQRWLRESRRFLVKNDSCAVCGGVSTDCDHKTPHKGDTRLFWDVSNWQALCRECHGEKSSKE